MTDNEKLTALARADLYRFLSIAFTYPGKETIEGVTELSNDMDDTLRILSYDIKKEFDAFKDASAKAYSVQLEPEYTELFLTRMHCSPNETSYGRNGFNRPNILGDISGFYKAFGFSLSDKAGVAHDNIAVQLEFMSFLALKEAYAIEQNMEENIDICQSAKRKFLDEHLGLWAGIFTINLEMRTSEEFYKRLAVLTSKFVSEELRFHGIVIDVEGVQELPRELDEPINCPAASGEVLAHDPLPLQ